MKLPDPSKPSTFFLFSGFCFFGLGIAYTVIDVVRHASPHAKIGDVLLLVGGAYFIADQIRKMK